MPHARINKRENPIANQITILPYFASKSTIMELYIASREEWRAWLEKNHNTEDELWLIYAKKASGIPSVLYAEAVEEALCFGWIDGKVMRIDEVYYKQRFTPRKAASKWSRYNVERVYKLIDQGLMKPAGLKAFERAVENPGIVYGDSREGVPVVPDDLMSSLSGNMTALNNFLNFPASSRRIYIEWLKTSKKAETRERRIGKIIELSEKNQKPGIV